MIKAVLAAYLSTKVEAAAKYTCLFGPDFAGDYLEEVVNSVTALNCDDFCDCFGHFDSTCYFGPDAEGLYIKEYNQSSEMADTCDKQWCICDTHDFEEGETFESEFQKREEISRNLTDPEHARGRPVT